MLSLVWGAGEVVRRAEHDGRFWCWQDPPDQCPACEGLVWRALWFYFIFHFITSCSEKKKSININLPTKISYHQSVQENIKSKLFLHLLLRIFSKVYFPYCADWSWQLCSSHLTVIIFSSRALLYLWYSQKQSVNVLGERDSIYREASRHYNTLSM